MVRNILLAVLALCALVGLNLLREKVHGGSYVEAYNPFSKRPKRIGLY